MRAEPDYPKWILIFFCGFVFAFSPKGIRAQTKTPPPTDADCLACHGQKDLKSASGLSLYVDPVKHKVSVHSLLGCSDCHTDITGFPHPAHIAKVECSTCHAEEASAVPKSVHGILGADACTTCHGAAHSTEPAAKLMPQLCTTCHAQEVKDYLSSIHGMAQKRGDPQSPTCVSCHGPIHKILTAEDPNSPVSKKNQPVTCGSCHANPDFLTRHQIPFARPIQTFEMSVHGQAVAAGNDQAASCSDCHSTHAIFPARDSRSTINRWNVPATCGKCHQQIETMYLASVHGQAVLHGATGAPVCTDCHGDHVILAPNQPESTVNPSRVSIVTCGRCHGNELLDSRYNLPANRLPTFADSYHGLAAAEGGGQTVANCSSCHGVHNIFPASDPRSTVNPANLAHTCGACHPGAGKYFAIGPVHVLPTTQNENPIVRSIRWIYLILIPLALGFMFLHNLLDFGHKLLHKEARVDSGEEVMRMNLHFRIAHWLTMLSFPVLVITGFALKFPGAWWARPLERWEGAVSVRGTLHRVAAIVLLSSLGYHAMHLIRVRRDRRMLRAMVPEMRDLRDLGDVLLYNLGFSKVRPTFGKFNYVEKMEYLAFIWGTIVMAVSGFALWFNNLTLHFFPKWVLDAATVLHYYEAILATFSILIWHLYTVMFDPDVYPMDRSWLTGKTSADHLRHTRPEYYAELMKEEEPETPEADSPTPPQDGGA